MKAELWSTIGAVKAVEQNDGRWVDMAMEDVGAKSLSASTCLAEAVTTTTPIERRFPSIYKSVNFRVS